jgi:hypothetical protein
MNISNTGSSSLQNTEPAKAAPAKAAKSRLSVRVEELLSDRQGALPVWIRAPKYGTEFYTGCSRAKLYEWASKKYIRSVSVREPGQVKGTRLFHLQSIFEFLERCESEASQSL